VPSPIHHKLPTSNPCCLTPGVCCRQVSAESLKQLQRGATPYYQNTEDHPDATMITSVPDSLAHTFYLPSDIHDSLLPATDQLVVGTVKEGFYAR
jgi:hypothetical protein